MILLFAARRAPEPSTEKLYDFDFACNDHRNGVCLGKFEFASLNPQGRAGDRIDLCGPPTRVRYAEGLIEVGGKCFKSRGHSEFVGNWCWDGALVDLESALAILARLADIGFTIEEAPVAVFDAWPTFYRSEIEDL